MSVPALTPSWARRAPRAALAAILLMAAFLRMGGLDHDVRRGSPAGDEEHNFVSPIRRMWSVPTADPTVRPGYPGFFNSPAFVPVAIGHRLHGDRGAYVGGRAGPTAEGARRRR